MSNEIEFSLGSILAGRFRLISELGAGGMGVAYRAWDQRADIPVVIKMPRRELLAKDPQFAKRFDREIRMMASLTHPNIVPIVDFGEDSGLPYVAMRFLPGGSLSNRRLRDRKDKVTPNHPSTLHLWLPEIASALDMVHSACIVHRDVKPGNIFFDGFWTAFLGDFGIAKLLQDPDFGLKEETLTGTNFGIGTPEYMSPEQFLPKSVLDGRSDQYALGIMVYEMLSGTRPFRGDKNFAVEHLTMPPPPLSSWCDGLPKSLCDAVHRSLSKEPDERFKSCGEFATAVLSDVPRRDLESDVVRLLCPSCQKIVKLSFTAGGKKGKCSKCDAAVSVAKDLGALWLESEAVGLKSKSQTSFRVNEKPLSTLTPASKITPVFTDVIDGIGGQTTPLLDPTVLKFGIVAALVAFVVIVALVLSHFSSKNSDGQIAALVQAQAENLRIQTELKEAQKAKNAAESKLAETATQPAPQVAVETPPVMEKPEPVGNVFKLGEIVTNSIGMELIEIPAGKFTMGDGAGVAVTLTKSFELGKCEVTQGQWKEVMGTEPWEGLAGVQADKDCPAIFVSWDDATEFCKKLTQGELTDKAYRLPTEAEWEYACRAGTTTAFSFWDDESKLGEYAWFNGNAINVGEEYAHKVGMKKPNPWGLHDMHGNVFEWCSDWSFRKLSGGTDPVGPKGGSSRVFRGGGWRDDPGYCRSADRGDYPSNRSSNLGFRVARSRSETVTVADRRQQGAQAKPAPQVAVETRPVMEKPEPVEKVSKPGQTITNSIGMVLIEIPAGTFTMGDVTGVSVTLTKPFKLGKYEVTQGEWMQVMTWQKWSGKANVGVGEEFPATYVSWKDATEFCQNLTEIERKAGKLKTDEEYRLPTEAEWEYACRAETTTAYSFVDDESKLGEYAWFEDNAMNAGEKYAHKVGEKKSNSLGLYDMQGNVFEWCSDWYDGKLSGGTDPGGPKGGSSRVNRGGSWRAAAKSCLSTYRGTNSPSDRNPYFGFRVARSQSVTVTRPVIEKPEPVEKVSKPGQTITNSIGMELIEIPAGTFTMGSPEGEKDHQEDEAQVTVTLTKPFGLGKYEVTQGQFKKVMDTEPWNGEDFVKADKDFPATYVDWDDATEFCQKLTATERNAGKLKAGEEYRLPTEAEWEYACRAETTTAFSFGNDESKLGEYAWFNGNAKTPAAQYAHKVGMKKPNPWGLHDMHGNVFEWCSDWYDEKISGGTDPIGPKGGSGRADRGGSWGSDPGFCRAANRDYVASNRINDLGFRVARSSANALDFATD